ncbi:complement C1q tumor necrosis factor-related protein 3 isoform X1 [Petromyzon marinus]|uniref:Complement C1q tumor necrosis factor-related protein 3 isoform X1 n=2 Tax=Petromyzon marinus TaxID=7757 RepID=A0AAJ7T125_PETMA|nr:complement C1q tumor necrosis factor-related protein 3 isoform X1 [Petromyzon marinus]
MLPTSASLLLLLAHLCVAQDEYVEVSAKPVTHPTILATASVPVAQTMGPHSQGGSHDREVVVDNKTVKDTTAKGKQPDRNARKHKEPAREKTKSTSYGQDTEHAVDRPHGPDCGRFLNAPGPRGYPGSMGPPGIPGNHGNNGNNGLPGREGSKGDKGDKGDLGTRGERGVSGPKGEKGQAGVPSELKIAFMASMATHFTNQNSGIIFSSVEANLGNYFDIITGRFNAPVTGVYYFTFNMLKHEDVEETVVYLMHNGNTVITLFSYEVKGKHDTAGNSAVLRLKEGDEVWLRLGNGGIHGDHQRFSTFCGFLLFETA